jgi:hypothetical protein
MKFLIYNPTTELFTFFINSLILELTRLNKYDEIIHVNSNNIDIVLNKEDIILIIINPHFIFDYPEILNTLDKIKNLPYKILYITEPINFIVEKKVYQELIKKIKPYCLWTYTKENFNKINTYLKMFKVFCSYNEEVNIRDIADIKDITHLKKIKTLSSFIVFFGNINENRIEICNQFNNYLINYTNIWSKEEWKKILNNNLFYLNIHRRKGCKSLETFRINPILANGGVIFSERCNKEEEDFYNQYNIFFIEKDNLYPYFINYIKNINYENIYEKANNFRLNMINHNFELNVYLDFHNNL